MIWHKGTGIIKYDPYRHGMKRKTEWWSIVQVDKEITRYYRWWVKNQYWIDLCQPSWDAHISIIRGERPTDRVKHLWKKYHNKQIHPNQPSYYWFVEVKSPFLTMIRDEMNLPSNWNFHITIGRTWY